LRTLGRLLTFLKPHRVAVAITAVAALGVMGVTLTMPKIIGSVVDDVLGDGDRARLAPLCLAFLALVLVRAVLASVRRIVAGHVSLGVETDLRRRLFAHLGRLQFAYFDRMPVGQLMSRATSDLQTVRFFLGYGLIFAFMHVITLLIVSVILFTLNPGLAALALLMGPALAAIAWRYSRLSNPVLVDVQQRVGEVTTMAEESAVGIRVIKAFGREPEQTAAFRRQARRAFDRSMDANRIASFYQPLMGFLPIAGLAVVLAVGGTLTINGTLTLGEFVEFNLYLTLLMFPFRSLGMLLGTAQRAVAGGRRIFEVLDAPIEITESPAARPLPEGGGRVRLEAVSFAYGSGRPVLNGIDLDVPAGTSVALIGGTGSGKSTLAQLVPRYYDATAGRVLLDGVDVRDLRLDDLRRAIGVVSQEPFLFSASIRENIAFGRPDASDAEVVAAAEAAQADGFVGDLPEGYDTVVGERGYTLSGGQRQRIAIARAIITDPRVLILDEATASVDASTERQIQEALRTAMEGRTTIVIAHRASTIALADRLVVLEHGRIAAAGTHDELYESSEIYREIHDGELTHPELIAEEA
jgi:ABC-type multidrug transport system fused ATPase/permease subunit